jgi:uncharacterized LabA/DUF88 family protein
MGDIMANKALVFVDFWNFQLSLNEVAGNHYRVDWKLLSPWLVHQSSMLIGHDLDYEGSTVYISCNPSSESDKKLYHFAINVLDRFPGVGVTLVERKTRNPPTCNHCHNQIVDCPHCGQRIERTIEKGVDTAIVTDMFRLSWESAMDVGVLVSSDRDFVPMVQTLSRKGIKVVNGHFPPRGMHLARTCWASIDISTGLADLAREPRS